MMLPLSGMGLTKPSPNTFEMNCCCAKTTNPPAPTGNTKEAAPENAMTNDTFALDAVRLAMELKHVLQLRKLRALTPYRPDAWEQLLSWAGLLHKYPHISDNLQFGLVLKLPSIMFTQTPPNHPSIVKLHSQFIEIIQDMFSKSHYIGPLSKVDLESLSGPFNPPHSPSSQIQPKMAGFESFRTTHSCTKHLSPVTINTAHGHFSFLSHTYSTSFPHLLHYDSYLSCS